jgi:hypothetical protein
MDQRQWLNDLRTFLDPSHTKLHIGSRGFFGLIPLYLSLRRFDTHIHVAGASGQGKSKFLQHALFELATKGHGCGVFDPHSDLASDFLAQLATYPSKKVWLSYPQNYRRVLYLDPSREDYVLPCNILRNSFCGPYEIAENVVEAFRRVWPDSLSEAPRFAQILRNAVLVLIANQLTLLELEPLLTNRPFRTRMLQQVTDPQVTSFFVQQFDRWGKREQPLFISPVLNKVSAFLFKPQVRLMLGANDNYLDFRKIIDSGNILIINLGCFHDEETKRLLGSLFLTSLEQATFSRSRQAASARRPYFCMIDEFSLFCSRDQTSLARILSECRKYRLHLGLAHQTIAQLPGGRMQGALENAKLKIIFGTGRQTAESIVKELFMPDLRAVKHEVRDAEAQQRTHPVFDPMLEQFERFTQMIQRLRSRRVLVKLPDREQVHRLKVAKVPQARLSAGRLEEIKKVLAKMIGKPCAAIQQEIVKRAHDHGVPVYAPSSQPPYTFTKGESLWEVR